VSQPGTLKEPAALRLSTRKDVPYAEADWRQTTISDLAMESGMRRPGQPRKVSQ